MGGMKHITMHLGRCSIPVVCRKQSAVKAKMQKGEASDTKLTVFSDDEVFLYTSFL